MVPGKKKSSIKVTIITEKIPGGKSGIRVSGLKLILDLKRVLRFVTRKFISQ
jgi:hypothetical protein